MAIITVLGAGMMGSALSVPLSDRGHEVRLVGTHLDGAIIDSLRRRRWHPTLAVELPGAVQPYYLEELGGAMAGADLVALGVSSAGARWAGAELARYARPPLAVFMITKGLAWDGGRLETMSDVVRSCLPGALGRAVVQGAVAGPCIAGELARRVPSCVVLAGRDAARVERIAAAIRGERYRVWTSTDELGVGVCAALKNAYAMGVALATGMHLAQGGQPGSIAMHNVESALFAQAVVELRRIVALAGGDPESAVGLAGVGDLDVTNNGGRTGRFGTLLGQGLSVAEAVARLPGTTLECLEILAVMRPALSEFCRRGQLAPGQLPLLEHLCAVALDGVPVALPLDRFFAGGAPT